MGKITVEDRHNRIIKFQDAYYRRWEIVMEGSRITKLLMDGLPTDKHLFYLALEEPDLFTEVIKAIKGE